MSAETVFYVSGAVLVVAALGLSAWGLRHEETFPNKAALRVGTVLFLALVAVVATFSVVNARDEQEHREEEQAAEKAEEAGGEAAETIKFTVAAGSDLVYEQDSVTAKAGPAKIELDNRSEVGHDVSIEEGGDELGKTEIVSASLTSTTLDLKPGRYVFFCSVPGHRDAGMEGDLTIK